MHSLQQPWSTTSSSRTYSTGQSSCKTEVLTLNARIILGTLADTYHNSALASAGGILHYVDGTHRPFPLTDNSIAYPSKRSIVSIPTLILISLAVPLLTILIFSLILGPRDPLPRGLAQSRWRSVAWKIHAGWLGLAAALVTTMFLTVGLKLITGKPRPDLLDRCNADLSSIAKYAVGGFGLSSEATPMVSSRICQQKNRRFLNDGFAGFPSGHASFSCAGLVYLSLWLASRLAVAIPWMSPYPKEAARMRWRQAAPPLWQVITVTVPVVVAGFISASRYTDFHHFGWDIVAGILLGTSIAWTTFRMYHMPVRRNGGFIVWEPRSHQHAFVAVADVDEDSYPDGVSSSSSSRDKGKQRETYTLSELMAASESEAKLAHRSKGGSSEGIHIVHA